MMRNRIGIIAVMLMLAACSPAVAERETAVPPTIGADLEGTPGDFESEENPVNQPDELEPAPTEANSERPSDPVTLEQGDATAVPIDTPAARQPGGTLGLKDPVLQAIADLSDRLNVSEDEIALVSLLEVTWRDGSLGCPEAGMSYIQVLTPGQQLVLRVNGQDYYYHSGKGSVFSYCGDPQPPIENRDMNPNQPPLPGQDN